MEIKGQLKEVFDTQQVTEKFSKREFVIETDGQYPDVIKLELNGDKCNLLDKYSIGDTVNVHFNLKGRAWTKDGKTSYFNTIQAWRIEEVGTNNYSANKGTAPVASSDVNDDDLPF